MELTIEKLLEENIALKEKINELTFELDRCDFELRDARRQLSKYAPPGETDLNINVGPLVKRDRVVVVEGYQTTAVENVTVKNEDDYSDYEPPKVEDKTQYWGHQDS